MNYNDERRIRVKVPFADLELQRRVLRMSARTNWAIVEQAAVEALGGTPSTSRYAACDGYDPEGRCLEVKKSHRPRYAGGNVEIYTSVYQLNEVVRTGGWFVICIHSGGIWNIYKIPGDHVRDYRHDR